jgi:peroxiredoxin
MDPMIAIGAQAPKFRLQDLQGQIISLEELGGRIVVLNFWSAECPWCERVDWELGSYMQIWKERVEVCWFASNHNETRQLIEKVAVERKLPRVFIDQNQRVADQYGAQTTPHFFVIDKGGRLAYQGAWDDLTFTQRVVTRSYVPQAVEALINHTTPEINQTSPYGCMLVRSFDSR